MCVCMRVCVCLCVAYHINRLDFRIFFLGCYTLDQLGDSVLSLLVGRVLKADSTVDYPPTLNRTIASPQISVIYKQTASC